MKKYLILGAAALGSAGAANAATPTITFTQGVYTVPSFTSASVFEGFAAGGPATGQQFTSAQKSASPYTETASGDVRLQPGSESQTGVAVNPDGGNDNYLSITNGTFTVGFGAGVQVFSFVLGSLDNYNSVRLNFSDGTNAILTGLGIIGGANTTPGAAPMSFQPNINGRVTYNLTAGATITSAVLGSTQAAFEVDDLAAAAPEPAAWALMIMGFGLVGSTLRARRRKTTVSFA